MMRRWVSFLSLLGPLVVVGVSAMAISYATLIDVARINGLPLPEFFPILVDVGTVACMVAAAQFRRREQRGRWLAYLMFAGLSVVSVFANATHASQNAVLTQTTLWIAAALAATPPAALLGITHLVMSLLPAAGPQPVQAAAVTDDLVPPTPEAENPGASTEIETPKDESTGPATVAIAAAAVNRPVVVPSPHAVPIDAELSGWVREYVVRHGKKPTGAEMGQRMGKSAKTGQRFLRALENRGGADEFAR